MIGWRKQSCPAGFRYSANCDRSVTVPPEIRPAMLLRGEQGREFGLTVVGYEYAFNAQDLWCSNFLDVAYWVKMSGEEWETRESGLISRDIEDLVKWLDQWSSGLGSNDWSGFMVTSDLMLKVLRSDESSVELQVELPVRDLHERLPERLFDERDEFRASYVLRVSRTALSEAARALQSDFARLSPRPRP